MKFVLCLLVLLPLVYCASIEDKRFIFGSLQIDTSHLLDQLQALVGSDFTESKCEEACRGLVSGFSSAVCGPTCLTLQKTVQG